MKLIQTFLPKIWCTRNEYPFGGTSIKTRAFFIDRRRSSPSDDDDDRTNINNNSTNNNVWIYGSSHVSDYIEHIQNEFGGVKYQLINHRDEASKYCNVLLESATAAPIFCHVKECHAIETKGVTMANCITYDGTKYEFKQDDDDDTNDNNDCGDTLIAYHTPGHTEGVTCYFYKPSSSSSSSSSSNEDNKDNNDFSVLFTGDSLYGSCSGSGSGSNSSKKRTFNIGPLTFHSYDGNIQDMINTLTFIKDVVQPTYIICGLIEGTATDSDEDDMNTFIMKFQPEQIQYHIDQLKKRL